jgi:hypothetical protein
MEDFIEILSHPTKIKRISFSDNKSKFLKTFLLTLLVSIGLSMSLHLLVLYVANIYNYPLNQRSEVVELFRGLDQFYYILFLVSIAAPLMEEFAFRLFVTTQKPQFLLGLISFFTFLSLTFASQISYLIIIISALLVSVIFFSNLTKDKLKSILEKNLVWIIHFSSIIFGLIHLVNYRELSILGIVAPVLVFPQITLGYFFAYSKLKLGFISAIALHSLYNLIIIVGAYFIDPNFR